MRRFAVGDLQGCLAPLQTLLDRVTFDPGRDQLWLVGDLINRGPDSLATLRYLYAIRHSLKITLGNHDLHTLALARGATTRGRHPTLKPLLAAPDLAVLMDWLRQQPLVYRDPSGDYLMSHAGIPHIWSSEQALALSGELEATLQGDALDSFLGQMYGNTPTLWRDDLTGFARLRCITNYCTRMRLTGADGELEFDYKDTGDNLPEGFRPWFEWPTRVARQETLIFGHWAALQGHTGRDNVIGLDTGCVWGNCMTLLNLDTGERISQSCPKAG